MKLDNECVRDLLLFLEENLKCNDRLPINKICLAPYSQEELIYTSRRLREANYINMYSENGNLLNIISSITYQGHQYLDSILDDGIWKETKKKITKLSSVSLPIIHEVASSIIKQQLGLP